MATTTRVRRLRIRRKYKRLSFYPVQGYIIPTVANNGAVFTKSKPLNNILSIIVCCMVALISIGLLLIIIWMCSMVLRMFANVLQF